MIILLILSIHVRILYTFNLYFLLLHTKGTLLIGALPTEIGNLRNLQYLYIEDNDYTGIYIFIYSFYYD